MAFLLLVRLAIAAVATYFISTNQAFKALKSKYMPGPAASYGQYGSASGDTVWDKLLNAVIMLLIAIIVIRVWPISGDELSGFGPYAEQISSALSRGFPGVDAAMAEIV